MREALDKAKTRFDELTNQLADPAVVGNPAELKRVTKERSSLEDLVTAARRYDDVLKQIAENTALYRTEKDAELVAMAKAEVEDLEQERAKLEQDLPRLLLPPDPLDHKNVIVEIRAGTGGEEAALFAGEMLRLYTKYAERHGWRPELLSTSEAGAGGLKEAVVQINGDGAYSKLKYESGVHRVQRVPETEASGRIHTSAATVAVLPEVEDIDLDIRPEDIRIDTMRAGGAGGQHVNKTDSAVRITHLPTGLVVVSAEKSQHQNRRLAMQVLRSRLYEQQRQKAADDRAAQRKGQVGSGDRSQRIRTYNFPQGRVTDHRIGLTLHKLDAVLQGTALDEMIDALITEHQASELAAMDESADA